MDQATADQVAPATIRPDPLADLVRNMTADTSAKLKAFLLPPREGVLFGIGPMVYRVGYINQGSLKFSSEFYGLRVADGIMRPGGKIEKAPENIQRIDKEPAPEVQGEAISGKGIG